MQSRPKVANKSYFDRFFSFAPVLQLKALVNGGNCLKEESQFLKTDSILLSHFFKKWFQTHQRYQVREGFCRDCFLEVFCSLGQFYL